MKIASCLCLGFATTFALTPFPGNASPEKALAKLPECMKLKATSPEQQRCLAEVETLRKAPVPKAAAAVQPKAAASKSVAAPATATKASASQPVRPEVLKAATELGLAGTPSPTATGAGSIDVHGMKKEVVKSAIQAQVSKLNEAQVRTQLIDIEKRNQEIGRLLKLQADLRALRPKGLDPNAWANLGANQAAGRDMYARLRSAGVAVPASGPNVVDEPGTGIYDARQKTFDIWNVELTFKLAALDLSQRGDMLRVQELNDRQGASLEVIWSAVEDSQNTMDDIFRLRPN